MDKKKPKKRRGVAAEKTTVRAESKKTPSKKKKVLGGKTKTEKAKTTKKTVKKEIKKFKIKTKKEKVAGKARKEETKKVRIKKKEKAQKKKVAKKAEKKITPPLRKKVEVTKVTMKSQKKTPDRKVVLLKKTVSKRPRKILFPQKEERYPPLPVEILSEEYGENSVALMIVDPRKLFVYWEVTEDTLKKREGTLKIRLYDVTGIDVGNASARSYVDIAIHNRIGNLYLDVNPEREFIADIGIIDSAGAFIMVTRSNKASTPREEVIEKEILPHRLYETGLSIPPIGYEK